MYHPSNTMRFTKVLLGILSTGIISTLSLTSNAQEQDSSKPLSPHQIQMAAPQKMLELTVEESTTAIVGASLLDLNVVITPFKRVKITHNTNESFTTDNNKLYFQANSNKPFSIFLTEDEDPDAPQYKLMFVPDNVPVGLQIKLIPDVPYVPKSKRLANADSKPQADGFSTELSTIGMGVAKFLADRKNTLHLPEGFRVDDDYKSDPYYIGNVLMSPEIHIIGTNYDVYVMNANNRANIPLQLSGADFATLSPTTGVIDDAGDEEGARMVGFYPRKVIEPGQSTSIILIHEPISRTWESR